ncbi:hypothetical protein INR49_006171 [Caranx melampygus]|nr:hypothetical protein INR49_006171 [Caranx melampygus]
MSFSPGEEGGLCQAAPNINAQDLLDSPIHTGTGDTPEDQVSPLVDEASPSSTSSFEVLAMESPPAPYKEVEPHWFFCRRADDNTSWLPFSREDSEKLERACNNGGGTDEEVVVAVDGERYDVHVKERRRYAVYWEQGPTEVRRCTWFYKGDKDTRFMPYPEDFSKRGFYDSSDLGRMEKETGFPHWRDCYFTQSQTDNAISANRIAGRVDVTPSEQARPRTVKRGVDNISVEIPDGEPEKVDHLVFMVHGIGPACDLRFRSIIQCVNDFRSASLSLLATHYKRAQQDGQVGRVEFLQSTGTALYMGMPLGHSEDHLPSISRLRHFTNDTLLDLFFYNSPTYCQTIVDTVASEINRLHSLFKQRHPEFNGAVTVVGHSLGSLILFDLLTNQRKGSENRKGVPCGDPCRLSCDTLEQTLTRLGLQQYLDTLQAENLDLESLALCHDSDLKVLGIPLGPRKKILNYVKRKWIPEECKTGTTHLAPGMQVPPQTTSDHDGNQSSGPTPQQPHFHRAQSVTSAVDYEYFDVGIGQVSIEYPQLAFHPQTFFAFGSPIGMFLTVRGLKRIDPNYTFPTCKSFYNIYHPYDPVAYRIEPMIISEVDLEPMLIPHHKGRKRMHLDYLLLHCPGGGRRNYNREKPSRDTGVSEEAESSVSAEEREQPEIKMGMLNGGRRIDYVLQEKPIESFNEYLFAIQSHLCYWESEDTALLLLKEIYDKQGVAFEQPQQ